MTLDDTPAMQKLDEIRAYPSNDPERIKLLEAALVLTGTILEITDPEIPEDFPRESLGLISAMITDVYERAIQTYGIEEAETQAG